MKFFIIVGIILLVLAACGVGKQVEYNKRNGTKEDDCCKIAVVDLWLQNITAINPKLI